MRMLQHRAAAMPGRDPTSRTRSACLGALFWRVGNEHAAVPQHVIEYDDATGAQQQQQFLVVLVVLLLVCINEAKVEGALPLALQVCSTPLAWTARRIAGF